MTSIWFNFLLKIFWPRFDSICISSLALLLCSPGASATLEWHLWIEARHCQLIINTLSCVVSLRFPQLSLPVYVCVSVWGVLLCVVRRLWDDLRAERCLPAQAPCLRIKAAQGSKGSAYKEASVFSSPMFLFFSSYPLFCVVDLSEITCCLSQIQTTGTCCYSDTGFLLPSISVPLQFFVPFLKHISSFRCCQIAHESACVKHCVCIFCLQSTSWFLTV